MLATDVLPRQVAILEALTAAISDQASALDAEGQAAVAAVVKASDRLAEVVREQLADC